MAFGLFGPSDKGRDKRRTFTQTQKHEILHQQNYRCAICKKKLDPRAMDFDHKKAWADEGRTVIQNGRALCKNCHGRETHNQRLKKVDKPRKEVICGSELFGPLVPKPSKKGYKIGFPFS
jgi:nitrate/TMAO reductase-like tetraheme cytochrome c subunit